MSDKIVITKTTVTVDTFFVPNTLENREAVQRGEYERAILDDNGCYQHLVDSYGESENYSYRLPD